MGKNILALGLLCALVPAFVFAGTGPRIHFTEQEHDLGEVIYGETLSWDFVLSNTGDADLVIGRITSSCGCTKAIRGNTTVSPGGSSEVFMQIRTIGMSSGKYSKSIAVHSNDPERPVIVLKLSFKVARHVTVLPDPIAGALSEWGKPVAFTLTAQNHGKAPVTLKTPTTDDSVEAELDPQEVVLPPGKPVRFRLLLRVIGQPSRPYLNGRVVIKTDATRTKRLPLKYFIHLPKRDGT